MTTETGIEWTDATWNPTTGCDKISPGCKHCYAETLSLRLQAMDQSSGKTGKYANGFELTLHPRALREPAKWKTPQRVFVNSMSDLLHRSVPTDFILEVFKTMVEVKRHTYQVLTKRGERWEEISAAVVRMFGHWPENVWPGVTVESRAYLHRLEQLSKVGDDKTIRMVSFEPLLESLVWKSKITKPADESPEGIAALGDRLRAARISWGISGGEAGFKARPAQLAWFGELRDACAYASRDGWTTHFFHKQHGGVGVTKTDKRGAEHALLDGVLHHAYPTPITR